jgi:hypothetical protein
VVGAFLVLAARSGSTGDDDDSAGGAATAADDAAGESGSGADTDAIAPANAVPVDLATARPPDGARSVISTADLSLEAGDPEAATESATMIAREAGGHLFSQHASFGDDASLEAVYKVPPGSFDAVLDAFAELGEVTSRNVGTEDVTGHVVDLEARLATARTSVERLRELLASSGNVGDLLSVEQALAQREGEAESLAAQLAALRARVDLATITLHVAEVVPATSSEISDDIPGFLAGLKTGAAAFGNSLLVVATVLGFALPFLPIVLVVGLATWYITRRRRLMVRA